MSPEFLLRFESVVARRPGAVAILEGRSSVSRPLSYRELQNEARRLARTLTTEHGIQAGDLVALQIPRGPRLVAAILATWYARAACLPLDLEHPLARQKAILAAAQPRIVLCEAGDAMRIEAYTSPGNSPERNVDDSGRASLAYVVFTSGSTGDPKGVAVGHAGIIPFLEAQLRFFQIGAGDRMLATLSPAFDAAYSELGTTLLGGATLVYASDVLRGGPDELAALLNRFRISHVCLNPATLAHWPANLMPATLKTIIIGGEAAPAPGVRDWARRFRVINVYGPSEATVCTSLWKCESDYDRPFLGECVPGMEWRVVDPIAADAVEISPGTAGELWLAGGGLAMGYWRDARLTNERFVERAGRRWYRTGDRVVRRHATGPGQLEFLGRLDRQIQVRGNRVEPLELERCLAEHPGICETHVEYAPDSRTLSAHVVRSPAEPRLPAQTIRNHVRDRLPEYFVPRDIFFHDAMLPRNANGKLDARRLARSSRARASQAELLREAWEAIFGVEPASDTEDFFEAGGTSFDLLRLLTAASAAGIPITLDAFYRDANIRGILREARRNRDGESPGFVDRNRPIDALREDAALDATTRRRIHRRACVKNRRSKGASSEPAAPTQIFMTGVTGRLGRQIVGEIVRMSDARILCLARDPADAQDQLAREPALAAAINHGRLQFVRGDLTLPRVGLAPADSREIAEKCDAILHCGARVHLTEDYERLRRTNLAGSREILKLSLAGPAKTLHYVSTLGVAVASDWTAGAFGEGDRLAKTRAVYGGYARSKWAAEALFHNAIDAGYDGIRIYRPGYLIEENAIALPEISGATAPAAGLLPLFAAALLKLGIAPEGAAPLQRLRMDCTPVAYAARAIAYLSAGTGHRRNGSASMSMHLANEQPLYFTDLLEALDRARPGALRRLPLPDFFARLNALSARRNSPDAPESTGALRARAAGIVLAVLGWRLGPRFGFAADSPATLRALDLFAATGRRFETQHTRAALRESGIECPGGNEVFESYLAKLSTPAA